MRDASHEREKQSVRNEEGDVGTPDTLLATGEVSGSGLSRHGGVHARFIRVTSTINGGRGWGNGG